MLRHVIAVSLKAISTHKSKHDTQSIQYLLKSRLLYNMGRGGRGFGGFGGRGGSPSKPAPPPPARPAPAAPAAAAPAQDSRFYCFVKIIINTR